MFKLAKQKDNGNYAYLGMLHQCADYFGISIHSDCAKYIVDTYLECINSCDFLEWIRGADPSNRVVVIDYEILNNEFEDLLSYSNDLEELSDLFMYLYDQELWVDEYEQVLYSTTFNLSSSNRKKLNYIGIAMEYERLCTLKEHEIIDWKDVDSFIECIWEYGYDMDKDYKYRTEDIDETVDNIIERMQQIFPRL